MFKHILFLIQDIRTQGFVCGFAVVVFLLFLLFIFFIDLSYYEQLSSTNMQQLRLSHFWLFNCTEGVKELYIDFHYLAQKLNFYFAFKDQVAGKYTSLLNLIGIIKIKCETLQGN